MTVYMILSLWAQIVLAQTPPARLLPAELSAQDADVETIEGAFPGALLVPRSAPTEIDDHYNQPFHAVCFVYVGEREQGNASSPPARYLRRFAIHVSDVQSLPLARRVARLLLLIYGENLLRLHHDHPSHQTVHVWLMGQGGQGQAADAGGEQFRDQIYIYQIYADRRPVEWMREVAHEYGHYALPGVTGFTSPEAWANGVLGERLFLKWLHDDLLSGRLRPNEIPFATPDELNDYLVRQVTPLIKRIATGGKDALATGLTRRDAFGMDTYTGLALYIDDVYGSSALLSALLYTEPKPGSTLIEAPDFLRGALEALRNAPELHITPPLAAEGGAPDTFWVYLPSGVWAVRLEGPIRSWRLAGDTQSSRQQGGSRLILSTAAWHRLTVIAAQPSSLPMHLTLRKSSGR